MPASAQAHPGSDAGAQKAKSPGGEAATKRAQAAAKRSHRQVGTEEEQHQQAFLRQG